MCWLAHVHANSSVLSSLFSEDEKSSRREKQKPYELFTTSFSGEHFQLEIYKFSNFTVCVKFIGLDCLICSAETVHG